MNKINAPPTEVEAMCGVDSLHIQVECSLCEITLFLGEMKMKNKIIKKTKYTTEMEIILAGEKITAVSTAQRKTTLQFGGLYYSRNSKIKLHFIRKIIQRFKDWKVKRLDFACDIKADFEGISVDIPDQYSVFTKDHWNGYYFNKKSRSKSKTLTYYIYDRSKRIRLFSFPMTRIEVRIFKAAIDNRNLSLCLQEGIALEKYATLIEKQFLNLHIRIGATRVRLKMNPKKTLQHLVEFLEGNRELPKGNDLFNLRRSLAIRDKLESWMKTKGVAWESLSDACWKQKALVCDEIGFAHQILNKAITFSRKNY